MTFLTPAPESANEPSRSRFASGRQPMPLPARSLSSTALGPIRDWIDLVLRRDGHKNDVLDRRVGKRVGNRPHDTAFISPGIRRGLTLDLVRADTGLLIYFRTRVPRVELIRNVSAHQMQRPYRRGYAPSGSSALRNTA